jgi:hypothetical protein
MTLLPRGVKVHLAFGFIDMRKGHRRARHAGPGCAAAGALLGLPFRFPGPESQPRQDRWHRPLPFHQAARARRVPMGLQRRTRRNADTDLGGGICTLVDWRRTGTRYASAIIEN